MKLCSVLSLVLAAGYVYVHRFYFRSIVSTNYFFNHPSSAVAKLHNVAVCISNRHYSEIGGTPFSVSYDWAKDYEIEVDATKCACDYYRQRHTGNNQWDSCPDCTFVR